MGDMDSKRIANLVSTKLLKELEKGNKATNHSKGFENDKAGKEKSQKKKKSKSSRRKSKNQSNSRNKNQAQSSHNENAVSFKDESSDHESVDENEKEEERKRAEEEKALEARRIAEMEEDERKLLNALEAQRRMEDEAKRKRMIELGLIESDASSLSDSSRDHNSHTTVPTNSSSSPSSSLPLESSTPSVTFSKTSLPTSTSSSSLVSSPTSMISKSWDSGRSINSATSVTLDPPSSVSSTPSSSSFLSTSSSSSSTTASTSTYTSGKVNAVIPDRINEEKTFLNTKKKEESQFAYRSNQIEPPISGDISKSSYPSGRILNENKNRKTIMDWDPRDESRPKAITKPMANDVNLGSDGKIKSPTMLSKAEKLVSVMSSNEHNSVNTFVDNKKSMTTDESDFQNECHYVDSKVQSNLQHVNRKNFNQSNDKKRIVHNHSHSPNHTVIHRPSSTISNHQLSPSTNAFHHESSGKAFYQSSKTAYHQYPAVLSHQSQVHFLQKNSYNNYRNLNSPAHYHQQHYQYLPFYHHSYNQRNENFLRHRLPSFTSSSELNTPNHSINNASSLALEQPSSSSVPDSDINHPEDRISSFEKSEEKKVGFNEPSQTSDCIIDHGELETSKNIPLKDSAQQFEGISTPYGEIKKKKKNRIKEKQQKKVIGETSNTNEYQSSQLEMTAENRIVSPKYVVNQKYLSNQTFHSSESRFSCTSTNHASESPSGPYKFTNGSSYPNLPQNVDQSQEKTKHVDPNLTMDESANNGKLFSNVRNERETMSNIFPLSQTFLQDGKSSLTPLATTSDAFSSSVSESFTANEGDSPSVLTEQFYTENFETDSLFSNFPGDREEEMDIRFQEDLEKAMKESFNDAYPNFIIPEDIHLYHTNSFIENATIHKSDHDSEYTGEEIVLNTQENFTTDIVRSVASGTALKGLQNEVGQYNCFLNVIIQSLWHIQLFRERLLSESNPSHVHQGNPCVICTLQNIFRDLKECNDKSLVNLPTLEQNTVDPSPLRIALSNMFSETQFFQESQMNDASEVLGVLFDLLHKGYFQANHFGPSKLSISPSTLPLDSTQPVKNHMDKTNNLSHNECKYFLNEKMVEKTKGEIVPDPYDCDENMKNLMWKNPCMIHSIFGLQICEQMECEKCNMVSRILEYNSYFLNINASLLRELKANHPIQDMSAILRQANESDLRSCDEEVGGCGQKNVIHHFLKNSPQVCIMVIGWQKIRENFDDISSTLDAIDTVLDLGRAFYRHSESLILNLTSVVCYYGQHYHCFAFNQESKKWIMFDDSNVKVVGSWENVFESFKRGHLQPQVLFYEVHS